MDPGTVILTLLMDDQEPNDLENFSLGAPCHGIELNQSSLQRIIEYL